MKRKKCSFFFKAAVLLALAAWVCPMTAVATPLESVKDVFYGVQDRTTFTGFLQQGVSFNTRDLEETPNDDKWNTQMIRSTLYGEMSTDIDWSIWTVVFRYDLEKESKTVGRIQAIRTEGGNTDDLTKDYYSNFDFREWYGDFVFADRFFLRAGKQQIVWGKTDFFSGLDIVCGYDNTWRSFLEAPNEQRRKPLIMGNLITQVPELNGNLDIFFRPGWDRNEDIGSSYDIHGGRWAQQPNKGVNFLAPGTLTYNMDHKEGKQEDPTYGIRWSGFTGGVEYSFNYLHSFFNDPVVNPSTIIGGTPYREAPRGVLGDFIFKQVDIVGLTLSYYVAPLDIVARTELSYTWDAPYNYGTNFLGGALPGFEGLVEKDVVRMMFNFDKNVDFVKYLGSYRPGFFSLQVFNNWVPDFKDEEDLVLQAGYSRRLKEHETIGTVILGWNYDYDRIKPQIAAGYDFTNKGGFFIPSLSFAYGNNWRLMIEYDMFFDMEAKMPGAIVENRHGLLHGLENNDQLYVRLQHLF